MIGIFRIEFNESTLIKKGFFFLFFFLSINSYWTQIKNNSFSYFHSIDLDYDITHPSIRPYLESSQYKSIESIKDTNGHGVESKFVKKLFHESLIDVHEKDVSLTVDPLFNFTIGPKNQLEDYYYSFNVRGFRITGDITSKVSFETRFYESQFFYPDYLRERSKNRGTNDNTIDAIAFGVGRAKNFKNNGLDAGLANGYVSFSPIEKINFQLGHGRHFFGSGYRSLLLSDYAPDYPYISGQYFLLDGKLLYKHVTAWLTNLYRMPASSTVESLFIPKAANFNQLSFHPVEKLSFSLFEGAIYNTYNSQEGRRSPMVGFYLPVIGSGLLPKDSLKTTNLIYGINWTYKILNELLIYNQYSVRSSNKIGLQLGLKWMKPFGLKKSFVNVEYNTVPTALYSMDSVNTYQRYGHLNHELAHPLGSGFSELGLKANLCYKRVFFRMNYNYALVDKQSSNNYVSNQVFTSNEDMGFSISEQQSIVFFNPSLGLYFNSETNMELSIGYLNRRFNEQTENYIMFTWRTYLKNDYFDQ